MPVWNSVILVINFCRGYFDRQYDQQRAQVRHIISDGNGNQIWYLTTKEETLKDVESSLGWFGYLRANLFNIVYAKIAYQDMYGKNEALWANPCGQALLYVLLLFLNCKEASVYYTQTNVNYINFKYPRNDNANISGR